MRAATLFAALAGTAAAADVPSIVIKGSKFFYENNGTQFFMRGVAYQQAYSGNGTTSSSNVTYLDPLADASSCTRDIPYLTQLNTNTIRVYAIDPTADHDACMTALANAGIYVVADLSAPVDGQSINRDSPAWNDELFERYSAVVDAMAKYTNVLGFFAGNEVSNAPNNTDASAFVKAAVRDTKAYMAAKNYRTIGVGYATNDDADIRVNMADYFNCGNQSSAIDFWGYNIYSWCGDSSYQASGYADRTKEFSTYSVPAFFAEYGCNTPSPRKFTEVQALYGSDMTPVWSGGIVYMYFEEANHYGLVSVSGNSVTPNQDFSNLASQIASVTPSGVNSGSYSPTNSPASCPATASDWDAVATPLPPTPNQQLCSCMHNSLACVVSPNVDPSSYGELFGTVCGLNPAACNGIAANASTGAYGAYGMCNATEQLAFAFDAYYSANKKATSACAFGGSATLRSAATPTGSCASLISQVGAAGTGSVTSAPTANAAANSGSNAGGSGSSASPTSSRGAAANTLVVPGGAHSMLPWAAVLSLGGLSAVMMLWL